VKKVFDEVSALGPFDKSKLRYKESERYKAPVRS